MRAETTAFLEKYRVKIGDLASNKSFGFNGAFFIPSRDLSLTLKVVASDGEGWEHVSVSLPNRCPTWDEMCYIKSLFWCDHEAVMQLHPPKSEYVNNVRYCLHMWRPTASAIPLPPTYMVGLKDLRVIA